MFDKAAVRRLIGQGQLIQAAQTLSARLRLDADDIDALKLMAEVEFRRGNREGGFAAAMRAVRLRPEDVGYALDCAFNLVRAGRRYDALAVADLISAQQPEGPDHRDVLGTVYTHCEVPEAALEHFRHAVLQAPNSAPFRYNLASVQRMLGDSAGAEENLDAAIRLDGGDGQAYLSRSQLRRQTAERNHVEELEAALGRMKDPEHRIPLGYALAKELEDLGKFGESFACLSAASDQQRKALNYDPSQELSLIRTLRDFNYPKPEATRSGTSESPGDAASSTAPIFVMGLPRSGTTLVERIVASSKSAESAGETHMLMAELWRAAAPSGRTAQLEDAVAGAVKDKGAAIAKAYMDALNGRFDGARFIDKTPGNYLFAGLIRAHMPGAKILCLRRSPMDSCYAMYKTLFVQAYPFTYDLHELADYFIEWDRLISHWEAALGDSWLTVHYEKLISDPEPTMRAIYTHCGLAWNDDALRFHELSTPVTSASAGQVSQPLNSRSVGLWRRYAEQLSGLADRLRAAGISPE